MELVSEEQTTATTDHGVEYIAETEAVYTDTAADGTESVAEITTVASPDDPTHVESHMTVTSTAPDGTETVREVISNEHGTFEVHEESMAEEIFEAVFDVEIPDEVTPIDTHAAANHAEPLDNSGFHAEHTETGMMGGGGGMGFNDGMHGAGDFQAHDLGGTYGSLDSSFDASAHTGTTGSDDLYTAMPDTDYINEGTQALYGPDDSTSSSSESDAQYHADYNADYADYYQDQANIAHDTSIDYMEHGDYDAANVYAESAEQHQDAADHWSDPSTE